MLMNATYNLMEAAAVLANLGSDATGRRGAAGAAHVASARAPESGARHKGEGGGSG